MPAEILSVARAQSMNLNTVGKFLNMLEKVAAENKLSDTPGNSFNIDESSIQINKTWLCNYRKDSKNINVLTSGEKNENIIL